MRGAAENSRRAMRVALVARKYFAHGARSSGCPGVIKVSARAPGPLFGLVVALGSVALSASACGGSAFKAAPEDEPETGTGGTTSAGKSGASSGSAGETVATEGGAAPVGTGGRLTFEPQPRPPLGGSSNAGNAGAAASGASSAGGTGSGGSAGGVGGVGGVGGAIIVQPPDEGSAGKPNVPEPPLDPGCPLVVAEGWTAQIDSAGSNWHVQFGDPRVDVANHRLVVSYDDVASPIAPYQGGYYVKTEVTLEGGTVLAPYPHATEMRWPSLRRSSNGSAVELGATKYGSSETWTTNEWPGFSGTSIAGAKTVTLTTYVKASAQALAVKVSYGAHTYRSGWISGFTWPETNLGILRYVGENNSRVYSGDAVYVGPLSGCQKLSDAAVEAAFQD